MKLKYIAAICTTLLLMPAAIANSNQEQASTVVRLLQEQVEKLAAENELLRKENQALRRQIGAATKDNATPSANLKAPSTDKTAKENDAAIEYWLSGNGKRHNSRCRYFKIGQGRPCGKTDGTPCKICGG